MYIFHGILRTHSQNIAKHWRKRPTESPAGCYCWVTSCPEHGLALGCRLVGLQTENGPWAPGWGCCAAWSSLCWGSWRRPRDADSGCERAISEAAEFEVSNDFGDSEGDLKHKSNVFYGSGFELFHTALPYVQVLLKKYEGWDATYPKSTSKGHHSLVPKALMIHTLIPQPARKIVWFHAPKLWKLKAPQNGRPDRQVNSDEQLQVANCNLSVTLICDKAWKMQPAWIDNTLEQFYDGFTAPREVCSACSAWELATVKSTRRLRIYLIINGV